MDPAQKKSINDLELDDLLGALENGEDNVAIQNMEDSGLLHNDKSVFSFVLQFNIKPGEHPVSKKALYRLFRAWVGYDNNIRQTQFTKDLSNYIVKHDIRFYFLNLDSISCTKKTLAILKDRRRNYTKSPTYQKNFEAFIKWGKLKRGRTYVELDVLYYIYDKWRYNHNIKTELKRDIFKRFCTTFFDIKKFSRFSTFIAVSPDIKKLITEKELQNVREGLKTHEKGKRYIKQKYDWKTLYSKAEDPERKRKAFGLRPGFKLKIKK